MFDDYIRCLYVMHMCTILFWLYKELAAANFVERSIFSLVQYVCSFFFSIFDMFFFISISKQFFAIVLACDCRFNVHALATRKFLSLGFFHDSFWFCRCVCVSVVPFVLVEFMCSFGSCNKINFTCLPMLKSWNIINTTLNIKFEEKTRLKKKIGKATNISGS